ncbi:hypothetical protein [Azospirillum palustre]
MLNVITDRFAIGAVIDHDVRFDLDRPFRWQRTDLDVQAVGAGIVAGFHDGRPTWPLS